MEPTSTQSKVLKALIAPARHSDGPTLYLICQQEQVGRWEIHEHLPDGNCLVWPEHPTGPQQAEAAIYGWSSRQPVAPPPVALEQ